MSRSAWLICLIGLAMSSVSRAQTWSGASGATSNWSDPGNWDTGVPTPGAETIVEFGAATRLDPTQDLADPFDLNQLNFLGTATSAYTLGGSPIRLAGGTMVTQQSSGNHRIDNPLVLLTPKSFHRFSGDGTGTLTLGGAVSFSGNMHLLKQGSHTLILDAPLTAPPVSATSLIVDGGTFRVNQSDLIDSSVLLMTSAGATFDLNGHDQTFANTSNSGTIQLGGGRLTLGIDAGTNDGHIGQVAGAGELIKGPGSARIIYSNPLLVGGVTVKNQGTLFVDANGGLGTTDVGTVIESGGSIHLPRTQYTDAEPLTLSGFGTGLAALQGSGDPLFAGPITLTADSNIGSAGGVFRLTGGINLGSSTVRFGDFGGSIIVEQAGITGAGGIRKIDNRAMLVINAPCTYTGPTSVVSGVMEVNTSLDTSSIDVNFLNPSVGAGILRGNMTAANAALFVSGGLDPGIGVGSMSVASATLQSFGAYLWEIDDPSGMPGDGFDVLNVLGELSAPAMSGFRITMRSLTPGGMPGPLDGFDNTQPYAWLVIDSGSLDSNVALADFSLSSSGFTNFNDLAGGMLGLDLVGDDLFIRFTPIPEPTAVLIVGLGMLLTARRRFQIKTGRFYPRRS